MRHVTHMNAFTTRAVAARADLRLIEMCGIIHKNESWHVHIKESCHISAWQVL